MHSFNCNGRLLTFSQPLVMGILNATPDSFFQRSRSLQPETLVERVGEMIAAGASVIDIGGQSTRPGAQRVSATEEADRVLPAIEAVRRAFPDAVISVDTFYADVARQAVAVGAGIINDVSAGTLDDQMFATVATLGVPYVLMHMQGDPQTMQQMPRYQDVVLDVFDLLNRKTSELHALGVKDIIIDPGFGFGKTAAHNFQLMRRLSFFTQLQKPILVGISRKGMVYRTLGVQPEAALNGSTVLHTAALLAGASMLRVHDVREAAEVVQLVGALQKAG